MAPAYRFAGAWLLGTALLAGPDCQASPTQIPIVAPRGTAPDPVRIADYPSALDAILRVLVGKFELPVPRYTLEIHATRETFEAALVQQLEFKPAIARTTAGFAKAAVGNRKVLVNEAVMAASDWPERVLTLAHEIVHTTQLELADHRRSLTRNQWLVEGFAEWIAFHVSDALGFEALAGARARMTAAVRAVRRNGALAQLRDLDSLEQWITFRNERGFDATYPLSFLVMDYLVERHSFATIVDYFRRFRSSGDHLANFRAAFGEDLQSFQNALDVHFARSLE